MLILSAGQLGALWKYTSRLEGNYLDSNWTNLNRVSNNKHCKYNCVVLSSFGQTNQLTTFCWSFVNLFTTEYLKVPAFFWSIQLNVSSWFFATFRLWRYRRRTFWRLPEILCQNLIIYSYSGDANTGLVVKIFMYIVEHVTFGQVCSYFTFSIRIH